MFNTSFRNETSITIGIKVSVVVRVLRVGCEKFVNNQKMQVGKCSNLHEREAIKSCPAVCWYYK